jgi:hypothetical protein
MTANCEIGPGIHYDIPASTYHALPFVSNSYLKKLAKCPANAKVPQEETSAMVLGRAAHLLVLEGEAAFSAECAVLPSNIDRRTKDGKAIYAMFCAENAGKNIIGADDLDALLGMRESVRNHPFAKLLLSEGVSETTVIFDREVAGHAIRCKCRPDRTPAPQMATLLDLKTTEDAGYDAFLRSCLKFGYITQAAFYIDGYNAVRGALPEMDAFAFIAVEKKPPYRCEVYTVDMDFLQWGREEYQRLLYIEAICRVNNTYPNYQNAGADDLLKPPWLM